LLRRYGGNLVKPGLIEIAPRYEEVFKRAISKITADFSFEKIFVLEK
jgi:hypothetical protein